MTAAIVQFQRKEDAKFICSACGADRGCQCSAPVVEKLAQKQEQIRRASKAYRERKSEENQQPRHMTEAVVDDEEDDIEADVEPGIINREDLYRAHLIGAYDQARRLPGYTGPVTDEIAMFTRVVAEAWTKLAEDLEFKLGRKRRRGQ